MKKLIWLLSLWLVSQVSVSSALAFPEGAGVRPMKRIFAVLEKLDLAPEQKTEITKILNQERDTRRGNFEKARTARQALAEAIHQEPFNEATVRAAYKNVSAMGEEVAVQQAKLLSQVRAQLTDNQKQLLASELKDAQHQRFRGLREKHGFGGKGHKRHGEQALN